MPDDKSDPDLPYPLLMLHRDIGRIEGRVCALEGAVTEIKSWLSTISRQVTEIHGIISSSKGESKGERTVINQITKFLIWLSGMAGTALTVWAAVKYGVKQ